MGKLDSNAAWKDASALVAANREVLLILAGVFFFLPNLLLALVLGEPQVAPNATSDQMMAGVVDFYRAGWLPMLLTALAQIVGFLAILRLMRDRQRPTVGEAIRTGFIGLPTCFAAQLMFALGFGLAGGLLVGLAALVLPALAVVLTLLLAAFLVFAGVRLILIAPVIALEGERNPLAAIARSWAMTKGNFWRILAFLVLVAALFLVGMSLIMWVVGIVLVLVSEGSLQRVLASVFSSALTAVAVLYFVGIVAGIHRQLSGATGLPDTTLA